MSYSSKEVSSIWGGRFNKKPSSLMQEINQSISFDYQLYKQDISASIVHAKMLCRCNIINEKEMLLIVNGLNIIEKEILENKFTFKIELEDIHMNIESRLKDLVGDVAGKLHTARSRNDQVATDIKLWIRDNIDEISITIKKLSQELITKAELYLQDKAVIMPGFTHLQVAQPILFSHHIMAYVSMLKRDYQRLLDCRSRLNFCPLGSAALAGTSFPIDRHFTATELNFTAPTDNSMDSVSDRDFAIEYLSTLSIISMHLSRFAEELIIWSSKPFDFISLPEQFTSGSSIMPQKKNPDAAELVRAKSGRIYGNLFSLLTVMKGLTLTYSKDMQEDKEPIFEATKNIKISIESITGMISDWKINRDKMLEMSKSGYSTATDIADWLVQNVKIPFREAHHITGNIVKFAETFNKELYELNIEELQSIYPKINQDIFEILNVKNSVESRKSFGGTSSVKVNEAIVNAKLFWF